ncbi:12112_t:CDS:2 [Racocetra fulgida]|uniref:12112_t:CDS:1 n=1 Tax=Racocetra fulgida TaxID=60492 RepID=A0A9N9B1F0_9GLOM|nr:12112_t:CDS:2 [Racocetra fulgida]
MRKITTQNFGAVGKGNIPTSITTTKIFGISGSSSLQVFSIFDEPTRNDSDDNDDDGKKSDAEVVSFKTGAKPLLHEQKKEEVTRHTVMAKLFLLDREHQWKDVDREHQWKDVDREHPWKDVDHEHQWKDVDREHQWKDVDREHQWKDVDREHQWKDVDREHQWKERMFKLNYPKNCEHSPRLSLFIIALLDYSTKMFI